MPRTALTLYAILLGLALGVRAAAHKWQTGSFGLRLPARSGASTESAVAALILVAAVLVGIAAPVLQLAGMVRPIRAFEGAWGPASGVATFSVGLAGLSLSQFWMGTSWRVGVDPTERTRLVTTGPFALVRNPIYSGMLIAILGASVLVPNVITVVGYALLVLAISLQVRLIEEPYLLRVHGQEYAAWAARVGRFIPGLGRGTVASSHDSGSADDGCGDGAPPPKPSAGTDRLHAFDALRALAMLLGIVAHSAMSYMDLRLTPLTWAHYDQATSHVLSWTFWWMQGFRLQLFFVLAGFFAVHLCVRRGAGGFLAHRVTSLLLPFVLGSLILLPLTYYIFAAGWWLRGACTWHEIRRTTFLSELQAEIWGPAQLWFIQYLFLYCVIFLAVRLVRSSARAAVPAPEWTTRMVSSRGRVLWWALPTFLVLWLDDTVITMHHNSFIPLPMKFAFNGMFFVAGVSLYRSFDQRARLTRDSGVMLCASLLLFAGVDAGLRAHAAERLGPLGHAAFCACLALFAWTSIFGFMGQAQRWLDRPHAVLRYLSGAAYWVYLLHLPLVAALQIGIAPLPVPALVKCAVVVVVTATVCLWSYERWVRRSIIGALLRGQWGQPPDHGAARAMPAPASPAAVAGRS